MSTTEGKSDFAELLKAINDEEANADNLIKSAPAVDDKKGTAPDDQTIEDASTKSEDDDDQDGKDADLTKSLTVTGPDGKPVDVVDATEIIKSLQDQVGEHGSVLTKALGGLTSTIAKQGQLIKSLQETVAKLGGQGAGRKAMLMAVEKPAAGATLAKSGGAEDGKLTIDEFFAKAQTAYANDKISGAELRTIDVCRRHNAPIDPALIQKVALS
jgi:hypothetical protein